MSYCRWSCMDHLCDVYAYEHCEGGFVVNVASKRPDYKEPLPPQTSLEDFEAFAQRQIDMKEIMDRTEFKPIGLPFDGETFWLETEDEMIMKLEELREIGYNVPDYALQKEAK